ncbi:hypothetical protein DID78_02300 [Candidatus Marinamargulisbacteria bacterium SCGC AG-343-D04]|nr:hypothetical protein DID78_02300 [Candidatus Marinamargulisbacteria bacterium SCGC AG-343-D04]
MMIARNGLTFIVLSLIFISALQAESKLSKLNPFSKDPRVESRKYQRKSLSSPEAIILLFGKQSGKVDPISAKQILNTHIELKRFDKNALPSIISRKFEEKVYEKETVSVDDFETLITEFYAGEIKKILENKDVQKKRIDQFKEKKVYTFEYGKGKSYSITADDLELLFNSSFFYVPYFDTFNFNQKIIKKKVKKGDIKTEIKEMKKGEVTLSGGVVWYQILIDGQKNVSVSFITHTRDSIKEVRTFDMYTEDDVVQSSLTNEAINQWSANIAHKTKSISQFKLVGRIEESDNYDYKVTVPINAGIQLNHYYWLMEESENQGTVSSKKVGLGFINKIEAYAKTDSDYSYIKQVYGKKDALSSWIKEEPTRGVDFRIGMIKKSGFEIDSNDSLVEGEFTFSNTITDAWSLMIGASLDISPYVKKSQVYFDIDASFNFVTLEDNEGGIPYMLDYYVGFHRAYWIKKFGISPFLMMGQHIFYIDEAGTFTHFQMDNTTIKYGVSLEKMIKPRWLLELSFYSTLGLGKPRVHYKTDFSSGDFKTDYSKLNWTGLTLGIKTIQ